MFDSMPMHTPVLIALIALILVVLAGGLFVAVRVLGQRMFDDEAAGTPQRPQERQRPSEPGPSERR